jgi:8-oxo-dGTP pyrophosphatase MutT (NUDIX family)
MNERTCRFSAQCSFLILRAVHVLRYVRNRFWYGHTDSVGSVRVIVIRDGKILLVRHWYAPSVWTLPGGGVHRGESIEDAGIREVREETGLIIREIDATLGTYLGPYGTSDRVSVVCAHGSSGSLNTTFNFEIMETSFFDLHDLPHTISPGNRRRVEEYMRGERNLTDVSW